MNRPFIPPSHRQALRLSRKLGRRGVDVNFTLGSTDVIIEVGRRVVHITPDGDVRPALKPRRTSLGWRADPQGIAAYHHRMQALYLSMAASARLMGSCQSGRIFVDSARLDRLYGRAF